MTESKAHSALCAEEAEETVQELRAELAGAGIILPSSRIDPTSWPREAPCPRIELGGCSVDTALRLAVAPSRAAGVEGEGR
ncbi:hypothetical protein ACFVXC_21390 [Streptomyces sp. NPDC058257]|uniref:hypothetical protein n=1 Tax=Streptomyces sp. NPDC058257 TaxID=3346409 RepID=UPI0036E81474